MHRLSAVAVVVAITASAHAEDKKYTLADLKALVEQKSYAEAVAHLQDVPPSERKAEYIDVAGRAAAGAVAGEADAWSKLLAMIEIEKKSPIVLKSAAYRGVRTDAAVTGFDLCFQNAGGGFQQCRDYALAFVDGDPSNGKLTLQLAKVVRRGMSHFAAVPFFKRALAANKPAQVCADEDLSLAVMSGLGLKPADERLGEAKAIAGTCFANLKAELVKAISDSGELHDHACEVLQAKKALTPDQTKACAVKKGKS